HSACCTCRRCASSRSLCPLHFARAYSASHSFFLTDTATTDIYTLSLHDALPICDGRGHRQACHEHRAHGRPPSPAYHCGLHHRQRHQPRSCSVPWLAAWAMLCCSRSVTRSPHRVREAICSAVSSETTPCPSQGSQPP